MFLTAPLDGRLFFADQTAAAGTTLRAVTPPAPFPDRAIKCAARPELAFQAHVGWPLRLFAVDVEDAEEFPRHPGLFSARVVHVREELGPSLCLGPAADHITAFLDELDSLTADRVRFGAGLVDDEYLDAHPDARAEDAPVCKAHFAANDTAKELGRELIAHHIAQYASAQAERKAGWLFDITLSRGRNGDPYGKIKRALSEAAYVRACGEVVADALDADILALLRADWLRFVTPRG